MRVSTLGYSKYCTEAARDEDAVIMTEHSDFIDLVCHLGSPLKILWLTCGNVTNQNLQQLLTATLPDALEQLQQGEMIVEIRSETYSNFV